MKTIIKSFATIITLTGSLLIAQNALAAPGPSGGQGAMGAGMTKILADIDGIIHSSLTVANHATYQFDAFLAHIQGSNTAGANVMYQSVSLPANMPTQQPTGLGNYISYAANVQTSDQNLSTLYQIPNQVSPPTTDAASSDLARLFPNLPSTKATPPSYSQILNSLTNGLPAVDSIYVSPATLMDAPESQKTGITKADRHSVTRPTSANDYNNTVFNANTFLFPPNNSYQETKGFSSSDNALQPYSLQAAEKYVGFLSQNYVPIWNGINFASLDIGAKNKVRDLAALKISPQYQKYQLSVRNLISARSLLMTMLNQMLAERSPVPNLGTNANLPAQYKNKDGSASPLQLEDFNAYHRLNNPKWYATMNTASPATVQRQTLYVLAQILGKMQQAHIDRERALSVATYQAFSGMQGMQRLVMADSTSLNTYICGLPGVHCPKPKAPKT
jgi:hypothetical protein